MVLYSTITTYQLLEAIVHKLKYNKNKAGILMISRWLKDKYSWYEKLACIFERIIVFEAKYLYEDSIEENLNNYFFELFQNNKVDLDEMEQIHVFGAEHSFGTFIFLNELEHYYWEEGAGALSKKDSMLEIFEKVHGPEKAKFQFDLHLGDGEMPFVKMRYYDKYFQLGEVEGENLCHFDLIEELQEMDVVERDIIIDLFYGKEKINANEHHVLLLTEHFANLSVMTWDEQILLYKYLVDYFLPDYQLLIKPHPDDTMYYEFIFENSKVIRTRFPAELLPFIFEGDPGITATSSSTSIYGLRSIYNKILEFNFKFSHNKQFYYLNRYYVALTIIDQYLRKGFKLRLLGVNSVIINNFQRFCNIFESQYEDLGDDINNAEYQDLDKTIWIIDELENPHVEAKKICGFLETLPEENIVVFINSDYKYCFYDFQYIDLWESFSPVEICMTAQNNETAQVTIAGPSYIENQTESIYIFQKGRKMDRFSLKKELPNVGITVSAQNYDGQEEKIKLLEGMLEATEKRLLYYIDREKELLAELEDKKS